MLDMIRTQSFLSHEVCGLRPNETIVFEFYHSQVGYNSYHFNHTKCAIYRGKIPRYSLILCAH